MALINCKKCSIKISDQALSCPHCNRQVNDKTLLKDKNIEQDEIEILKRNPLYILLNIIFSILAPPIWFWVIMGIIGVILMK